MLAALMLLALMMMLARPDGIAEARPRKAGRKRGSRGKRVPTYNPHAIEGDFDDDEFESAGIATGASAFDQEDAEDDEREEKEEDDDEISADEEIQRAAQGRP